MPCGPGSNRKGNDGGTITVTIVVVGMPQSAGLTLLVESSLCYNPKQLQLLFRRHNFPFGRSARPFSLHQAA